MNAKRAKAPGNDERDAILNGIAKEHLHLETLERRWSDSLDFHDTAVWSVRSALEAAYEAGRKGASQRRRKPTVKEEVSS